MSIEHKKHRYIVIRGVKFWNTNQIAFRAIYGNGFLEYCGPDDEHQVLNTCSEIPLDSIEQALARLGFHKSEGQPKAE